LSDDLYNLALFFFRCWSVAAYYWSSKGVLIMTVATIEKTVVEKLRLLPPEKQQEALDFIEFLGHKIESRQPRKSSYGMLADLNISISKEEINEAHREAWANFPRERFFKAEERQ
jgi:hypothetical protein